MAKGDSGRAQRQIDTQGAIMQTGMNNLNQNLYGANNQFMNNYNTGTGMNLGDYGGIMGNYNAFMQNPYNPQFSQPQQQNQIRAPYEGGGATTQGNFQLSGNINDPNQIMQFIQSYANKPGANPSVANDPNYWAKVISEHGGLTPENMGYFGDRMMTPEGAPAGGGGAGAMNPAVANFYSQLMQGGGGFGWDPQFRGALGQAIGGYGNFAETGGFSPQDIQDIRARAVAPTRSVFSSAMNNVDRQRSLQGGYSPNYTAAMAKMARDLAYGISDANVNANAGIAQMVQQGKLAGLGGLTSAGLGGQGMENSIAGGNLNARLAGAGGLNGMDQFNAALQQQRDEAGMAARLQAMGGMNNLYGTTPGLSNMFGNQVLQSQGNLINAQQLQNQAGLGMIGGQINKSAIPGDFSQAMGNIGSVLGLAGRVGGSLFGLGNIGGLGSLPKAVPGIQGAGGYGGGIGATLPGTKVPGWGL